MSKKPSEHEIQVQLMQWCHRHADERLHLIFAIPNGGHRHKSTAMKLKMEGVKPGIPDLMLPVPTETAAGLFLEMKAPNGRVSDKQRVWLDTLRSVGYHTDVAWSLQSATTILEQYLHIPST